MANNEAELKRAARRKARILKNPEDRINKILGNPETETSSQKSDQNNTNQKVLSCNTSKEFINAHTSDINALQIDEAIHASSLAESSHPTTENIRKNPNTNKQTTIDEQSHTLLEKEDATTFGKEENSTKIVIWIIIGILTRILLATEYAWVIGNSAIGTFVLAHISMFTVQLSATLKNDNQSDSRGTSQHTLVEMALRLCGLPTYAITTIMYVKKTFETLLRTFSLFFVPFVMVHLVAALFQANHVDDSEN